MAEMVRARDAYAELASELIISAMRDLIRQQSVDRISVDNVAEAAEWFADGGHEPWCELAGVDADAVLSHARALALQYAAAEASPHLFGRPRLKKVFKRRGYAEEEIWQG